MPPCMANHSLNLMQENSKILNYSKWNKKQLEFVKNISLVLTKKFVLILRQLLSLHNPFAFTISVIRYLLWRLSCITKSGLYILIKKQLAINFPEYLNVQERTKLSAPNAVAKRMKNYSKRSCSNVWTDCHYSCEKWRFFLIMM